VSIDDFQRIELRAGVVVSAERVPRRDDLLDLGVDVGEPIPRRIIAPIARSFAPERLVGQRVVVAANLTPRDLGDGLVSFGELLATADPPALATVAREVPPGTRLP
jgi:methionine--tRNA ligase beta chain